MSEDKTKQQIDTKQQINELTNALRQKYKIKPEEKGLATNIDPVKEEIKDKNFINIEEFTNERSRYIESKYGLKPMSEIVSPKTNEQKQKELEEYIQKQNHNQLQRQMLEKRNSLEQPKGRNHISQYDSDRPLPKQYKWFEDMPGYKPEVNVGQKLANAIEAQVKNENELNASLRKGGFMYQSWKKGKLGIDKYLLIIGLIGAFAIPSYIYNHQKKYKEFLRQERGLKPGEQIDLENGPWDIDDISSHKLWYDDKEERTKTYQKLMKKKEIRKLEEEIYGKEAFGSSYFRK